MAGDVQVGIVERSISYALEVIRLYRDIESDSVGRVLGKQVLRSATSVGANVHEAQGGQSRADFIATMFIAHKEARESAYRVRLLQQAGLDRSSFFGVVRSETEQIHRILAAIVLTARGRNRIPSQ